MWFEMTGDFHLTHRCATENCWQGPTWRLEVDGYGSYYCGACKEKIEAADHEAEAEENANALRDDERRHLEEQEMAEHYRRYPHG